ncbi:hypothetical protein [Flavobacterium sp.]|uniref:hypothetical protein n=1 Tax=Flavobacterium sp. TaxID=239 RepID=UPI004047179A
MIKKSISIFLLLLLNISCTSKETVAQRETWKTKNYINTVQILLTNSYEFKQASGSGASSFLIKAKGDTLLCTAKHLLGEAMGIDPEIKTNAFNTSLKYWKAFPRDPKLSTDPITGKQLVTEEINEIDIILQKCKMGTKNNIIALSPRFTKATTGETFEIIGCEYSDFKCHQRVFSATYDSYENGQLYVKSKSNFDATGFSGAPVIDKNGLVIGILTGGGEFEDDLYLVIEPLTKIESYLK